MILGIAEKEVMRIAFGALSVLVIAVVAVGCASPASRTTGMAGDDVSTVKKKTADAYYIGVDDQIQVNVWRNEDLSVSVPVRPDGMISVPLIGDVEAGGHTPQAVAKEIETRLSNYIRDPNVTVLVTELRSHAYISRVRVTGAVQTPVSLPHRQGMTVLDLVLEAGGVTEFAAANSTRLYRRVDGETSVMRIRLADILEEGNLETNAAVLPGDVISVPERLF